MERVGVELLDLLRVEANVLLWQLLFQLGVEAGRLAFDAVLFVELRSDLVAEVGKFLS